MKFNYQARTKNGKIETGTIEASTRKGAIDVLHQNNLFPTAIKETSSNNFFSRINYFQGVPLKEITLFSRELATMLDSKVPLAEALDSLGHQTRNIDFQNKIYKISMAIREGSTFSKALSIYPKDFSSFYVSMVRSGEASGNLSEVLDRVSIHLEKDCELRSKTLSAMMYPSIVLSVFILIFIVLMVYVVPNLTEVLATGNRELPLITQLIIGLSDFFKQWWIAIIGSLAAFAYLLKRYLRTKEGKRIFDQTSLRVPILGRFFKNLYLARFAENFSVLIAAGIPIAQALEITADIIGNVVYRDIIIECRNRVIKGEPFSSVLDRFPEYIPSLFVQMASVGERTGRISNTLTNIVRFYQREIDTFVDGLSSILEPILIIGLALMVGILVAAVVLPLYQMSSTF
ncbi:MAG: type II secretion system F family protein [Candidatus Paceibacterota bacterium]|jgi:type II secretory pathway component PulF|nr:type II secretion system F family protein [Candidatus Paceibacterota bacterium]MDD4830883.1 type II secretion system F family protein [Candidatus Paceibacterota bacterium]MDD4875338.1 type II secretion system F family protein [Candidatus Paceibacterota bacterium]